MGSFAVSQVPYLIYMALRLWELWLEIQVTLLVFNLTLHLEAHQSALSYLLSSKTIMENQEDGGSFLPQGC